MAGEETVTEDPLAFFDAKPDPTPTPGDDKGKTADEIGKVETKVPDPKIETLPAGGDKDDKGGDKVELGPDGKPKETMVPLSALLGARSELTEVKTRLQALEKKPEEEVEFVPPDPKTQPAEYAAYREQVSQLQIINERMNTSERFARKEHGDELITKVRDWATARMDKDPAFADRIVHNADPYAEAVKAYNEEQVLSSVKPTELDAFRAWQTEQAKKAEAEKVAGKTPDPNAKDQPGKTTTATASGKAKPASEPIPRSIVDETGAGGTHTIPIGEGQAFDSVFKS